MSRRDHSEPPPHAPFSSLDIRLPCNLEAERLVLGLVLLNYREYWPKIEGFSDDIFSLEKHRRIFDRMKDLAERQESIDRVTLADELIKHGQLESVDGLTYLVSLDDGLPQIANIEAYLRILSEKHSLRTLIFKAQGVVDQCLIGESSPIQILDSFEQHAAGIRKAAGVVESDGRTPDQILSEFPGGISSFVDPSLRPKGLSYGFSRLDEYTTGMHGGEFIVLAARPRVGKSALALNVAAHVAMALEKRVHYFSLEMSAESLLTRLMCSVAKVDQHKFRAGYLNADERYRLQSALSRIADAPLVIDDRFRKTLPQLSKRIKESVDKGCALVILDQIGLMKSGGKTESRQLELTDITRTLKLTAMECNIPIIGVNQIRRPPSNQGSGRPTLEELKGSGSLEEDADTVLTIFREELIKRDRQDLKGLAEVDILKQRNGMEGSVKLRWVGAYSRFEDRDASDEPDAAED